MIFYAASALFVANFALGVLVQFGIVDTRPFRWLHHALFFAVFASAALAVAVGFLQGRPTAGLSCRSWRSSWYFRGCGLARGGTRRSPPAP